MLTCANLHMSRFAHVSKSKFAMRSDESYVPWANTWNIIWTLGNRLLQTCEFSRKLGVSLLFEYIDLQVDVPDSDRETKIKHPIHRLLRQNHNIIIFEDKNWNEKGICLKMLQNVGIGGGGGVLSGDVVFAKNVLIDNLFTAWALTGNLFHAIPRHEYIFIFKSPAGSLQQCCINY